MGPIDIIRIFRLTHANWTHYFAFLFATGFCYRMIASTPAKRSIIYSFIFLFNTLKSNKLREREREKKTKATTTINESRIMDCMPKFSLAKIKWSQLLRLLLLLLICAWHEFWAEKIHRKLDLVVIGRVVKDRGGERVREEERERESWTNECIGEKDFSNNWCIGLLLGWRCCWFGCVHIITTSHIRNIWRE